jgi:hypothetical protein
MHAQLQPVRSARGVSDQRSVAELLGDVICNLQDILSSQIRLAQAEAHEELRTFRSAGTLIMIAILGGLLSALFLLLAIVAALSLVMSLWVAALFVALGMAVLCGVVLRVGVNLVRSRAAKIAASAKEKTPWTGRPIE